MISYEYRATRGNRYELLPVRKSSRYHVNIPLECFRKNLPCARGLNTQTTAATATRKLPKIIIIKETFRLCTASYILVHYLPSEKQHRAMNKFPVLWRKETATANSNICIRS